MIFRNFAKIAVMAVLIAVMCGSAQAAGNIDATNKYAWATNAGWVNFNPTNGGGTVYADHLEGDVWAENIGWIRLGSYTGGGTHTYGNTTDADFGVNNTTAGVLSGYAWSTNAGWINFKPTNGGVTIDSSGNFSGYAWGENIGWINFAGTATDSSVYKVVTTWTPVTSPVCTPNPIVINNNDTGAGSLRQAVIDVCDGDTITFDAALSGQTITLTSEISMNGRTLTIDGSALASQIAVSGNNAVRVFNAVSGTNLTIRNLTVKNGNASGGDGGGINVDSSGSLSISNSSFSGNSAFFGGAIRNGGGTLVITGNSVFSGNSATGGGGAISNSGTFTATGVSFLNNIADNGSNYGTGGGFQNDGGSAVLNNCTFNGNQAKGASDDGGGAVMIYGGSVTLNNCTLSNNSSASKGGGISVYDNTGSYTLGNTAIFGNSGVLCPDIYDGRNASPCVTPSVIAGVSITKVDSVTSSTVVAYGTATGTGITERGFFWWIPPTPENHFGGSESGLIPEGGYSAGDFSLNITGPRPGNTYHVKAYIKAGGQIITSDESVFTTAATGATGKMAPTVVTTACSLNADGTVSAAGQITDIGSSAVNVYGFVYAKHSAPYTGENMAVTGDRALALWDKAPVYQGMSFAGTIKNLSPGKWYLRAYAHNDNPDSDAAQTASLGYGGDCSFTVACIPETCVLGDANGDGKVDLADAIMVLQIVAGITPVQSANLNADVNGDCRIGLEEVAYVLQKMAILR